MSRRNGSAVFSACGMYRYLLGGDIGPRAPLFEGLSTELRIILWIMLNPSTADAMEGDQTIDTAVVPFSELWGFDQVLVGNLYAFKSKKPKVMAAAAKRGVNIVGPANDGYISGMVEKTRASNGRVMVAWGANADRARAEAVHALIGEAYCLRTNKDGSPVHPLYQPHRLEPTVWKGYL